MNLRLLRLLPRSLRHWLIRKYVRVDERELDGVEVRVASTVDEYLAAAKLVHDGYVGKGIDQAHGTGVRVTPFLALPSTVVFGAFRDGTMIGTMSLVVDSSLGLPLQRVYRAEVDSIRAEGRRVAECGSLCVDRAHRGSGVSYLLYKAMFSTAQMLGVDDLVIAVHPHARDLYEAALCFEQVGGTKRYPGLNRSAQAVALRLRCRESRDLALRAFGSGTDLNNAHYLYFERREPRLLLPPDELSLRRLIPVHQAATLKLAALRPDMVSQLCDGDFQRLRSELRLGTRMTQGAY